MNRRVYDLTLLLGTACITAGVAVQHGVGPALITAGGLLIGLTIVGVLLTGKR